VTRHRDLIPATGPLLDRILDSTFDIWNEGLTRAAYRKYYAAQLATPWGRAHLMRWALVEAGEILASAKEYRFDATLDGRAIRIVGIGAVFTEVAHRGRGYALELIERLLERSAGEGADLALLFSEIGADYYARLGFTSIPRFDVTLSVVESTRRGAPATLMRAGEDRDLNDVAQSDRMRAEKYRFHLNRDRDLAHFAVAKKRLLAGLLPPGARELQFFVAEEGASAVAHVVIMSKRGEWTIEDAGDRDPAGARMGALMQVLVARDPAEQRPAIRAWLPEGFHPPQLRIVARVPSPEVMMMRPLSERGTPVRELTENDVLYWRADMF
jgi:predicted N-acetyltransferase YhbS